MISIPGLWVVMALLTAVSPMAAAEGGALRVTVIDASNAVIPGALVTVTCGEATARTAHSDDRGVAAFLALPVGECLITVERTGFQTWRGKGVASAGDGGGVEARLDVKDVGYRVPVKPKSAGRRFVDWLSSCTRR